MPLFCVAMRMVHIILAVTCQVPVLLPSPLLFNLSVLTYPFFISLTMMSEAMFREEVTNLFSCFREELLQLLVAAM
jgi:hypothetical protein